MKKRILATALSAVALTTPFACSHRTIEFVRPPDASVEGTTFSGADASVDATDGLINYCPSTRCTNNTATCPGSVYPCDVDLMTDINNCGACGASCGLGASWSGSVLCSNGQCVLGCAAGRGDCNGSIEDGCETDLSTDDNCNACGQKCTDPAHPCRPRDDGTYQCGCPDDYPTPCYGLCYDLTSDDKQCGACGNECDKTGGGAPSHPNMYYGCLDSTCDKLKCEPHWSNCNGDIEDGCETNIYTDANCGGCGIACAPGQTCGKDNADGQVKCLCPPGLTLCNGFCIDVLSDYRHCGGCNNLCNIVTTSAGKRAIGACVYGACVVQCLEGFGDCNGDASDNCEAKLSSDPNNCGGCGIHCLPSQACIGGQCAVEPCTVPETKPQ